jgi:hypothetical protein
VKVLDQIRRASFWGRYWSLLTALALPVLVFFFLDFQNARTLVSIISIVLLAHAWRMQMRGSKNIWRSLLWTSVLLLPMLGAIWLGLNVIRGNTYEFAADYQRHLGDYRQRIVWTARVDILVGLLLAVASVFGHKETNAAQDPTSVPVKQ